MVFPMTRCPRCRRLYGGWSIYHNPEIAFCDNCGKKLELLVKNEPKITIKKLKLKKRRRLSARLKILKNKLLGRMLIQIQ